MEYRYPEGRLPTETLVIYRLKFSSRQEFTKAIETVTIGKNLAEYIESFKRSTRIPITTETPEVNACHDDLCIYIVSKELEFHSNSNVFFPVNVGYYKPYLSGAFPSAKIQATREIL
jgi:hypothetical protein